jgi:hypothetical protein
LFFFGSLPDVFDGAFADGVETPTVAATVPAAVPMAFAATTRRLSGFSGAGVFLPVLLTRFVVQLNGPSLFTLPVEYGGDSRAWV